MQWLKKYFGRQVQTISRNPKSTAVRLAVETLESRLVPTTAWINRLEGILHVDGTDAAETIQIRYANNQVQVLGTNITVFNASLTGNTVQTVSAVSRSLVFKSTLVFAKGGSDVVQTIEAGNVATPMTIYGEGGDDWLYGGSNNDTLVGGDGRDSLYGYAGVDYLKGAQEYNVVEAGDPRDYLNGGVGSDALWGGNGDDTLVGGDGRDYLWGEGGSDQLKGGQEFSAYEGSIADGRIIQSDLATWPDDYVNGGPGSDWLWGGDGTDTLVGGDDSDHLYGEDGNDTLKGAQDGSAIETDNPTDWLYGGANDDTLYGGDGTDFLIGGDGSDHLYGEGGNDNLKGAQEWSPYESGNPTDWLYGGPDNDDMWGGEGTDFLIGGDGSDHLYGEGGNDNLKGAQEWSAVEIPNTTDWLYGGGDNDDLWGGDGNDILVGGDGSDHLYGENGNDLLKGAQDSVPTEADNPTDYLYGGPDDDSLYGGDGMDYLYGDTGNDLLVGESGPDQLYGGPSYVTGLPDNDTLFGAWPGAYAYQDGTNNLFGYFGNDNLYGGNGADALWGGAGDDGLFGGRGNNYLNGGADDDRFLTWSAATNSVQDPDPNGHDATIHFVNSGALANQTPPKGWPNTMPYDFNAGAWTELEIQTADRAFANLQRATGNSRLLRLPNQKGQNGYVFTRRGQQTSGDWDYGGQNNGGGQIVIGQLRDATLSDNTLLQTIYHEIGHSWLVNDVTVNSHYQAFLDISGWRQSPTDPSDPKIPGANYSASDAPGDDWWYLSSAAFARTYSRLSIDEDYATTWETYFMDIYHGTLLGNNKVQAKYDNLDLLFADLSN